MYKYRLKKIEGVAEDASGIMIPGHGMVVNGMIESQTPIENPNLELVSGPEDAQQVTAPAPSPAHMTGVVPQNQQGSVPQDGTGNPLQLPPQQTIDPQTPQQPTDGGIQ